MLVTIHKLLLDAQIQRFNNQMAHCGAGCLNYKVMKRQHTLDAEALAIVMGKLSLSSESRIGKRKILGDDDMNMFLREEWEPREHIEPADKFEEVVDRRHMMKPDNFNTFRMYYAKWMFPFVGAYRHSCTCLVTIMKIQ